MSAEPHYFGDLNDRKIFCTGLQPRTWYRIHILSECSGRSYHVISNWSSKTLVRLDLAIPLELILTPPHPPLVVPDKPICRRKKQWNHLKSPNISSKRPGRELRAEAAIPAPQRSPRLHPAGGPAGNAPDKGWIPRGVPQKSRNLTQLWLHMASWTNQNCYWHVEVS